MENQKIGMLKAQFNSISTSTTDPSLLIGKVIVHDFEVSGNNQLITEEVCIENMQTLVGKRIVCKYISNEDNEGIDALGDHAEKIAKTRDNKDMIITETLPIGFISNVYIDDYTDENGNTKRVLFADVVIWNDEKFSNITGLLREWLERGIKIHMSVEYLYCNYEFKDGVEILKTPILYVAHTLLNSEDRGNCVEVLPAYDIASLISLNEKQAWNKAINNAIKQNNSVNIKNKKEDENMAENKFYKALCELSHGDIRDQVMSALYKTMTAEEFEYVWISSYGIYNDYFVYENWEADKYVYYKVPYTKTETEVVVDLGAKVVVERDSVWVEVGVMEQQTISLNAKIEDLTNSLNTKEQDILQKDELITSLNTTIKTLETEKSDVTTKFNEQTDVVVSLNSKIKEYEPIVEIYNKEQYEKSLNSAKEFYREKFNSVEAMDEFEKDTTQELIKKSVNSNEEESKNAKFALSELIVSNVKSSNTKKGDDDSSKEKEISLNSITKPKENKDLIEHEDLFEKTYGFKKD